VREITRHANGVVGRIARRSILVEFEAPKGAANCFATLREAKGTEIDASWSVF
jgi:hypothetical protein